MSLHAKQILIWFQFAGDYQFTRARFQTLRELNKSGCPDIMCGITLISYESIGSVDRAFNRCSISRLNKVARGTVITSGELLSLIRLEDFKGKRRCNICLVCLPSFKFLFRPQNNFRAMCYDCGSTFSTFVPSEKAL